jgi:hypothetical protein
MIRSSMRHRARNQWARTPAGRMTLFTNPLDLRDLLREALGKKS